MTGRAGRMELAVRRDLRALPDSVRKGVLAEGALMLARQIDAHSADSKAGKLLADLWAQLRVTLKQLQEVGRDGGDDGKEDGDLSTPVWEREDTGAADAGAAGGGGGAAAG